MSEEFYLDYEQIEKLSLEDFYKNKKSEVIDWKQLGDTLHWVVLNHGNEFRVEETVLRIFDEMTEKGILRKKEIQKGDYLIDGVGIEGRVVGRNKHYYNELCYMQIFNFYPIKEETAFALVEHLNFRLENRNFWHTISQYVGKEAGYYDKKEFEEKMSRIKK